MGGQPIIVMRSLSEVVWAAGKMLRSQIPPGM